MLARMKSSPVQNLVAFTAAMNKNTHAVLFLYTHNVSKHTTVILCYNSFSKNDILNLQRVKKKKYRITQLTLISIC